MKTDKKAMIERAEALGEELVKLSHSIWSEPELGFKEFKTLGKIREFLAAHGYTIEEGIGGLETAFRVSAEGCGAGPHIAIMAEYDALAGIGHGCGHNIICTTAIGAFLALAPEMKHLPGKLTLLGTPAEEGGHGKVYMIKAGLFDDVDFALMMHPSSGTNQSERGGRACNTLTVKFTGKAAHSSNPDQGINALTAAILTFNNLNTVRDTFNEYDNINGIISKGGDAPNIIPAYAECKFSMRAKTLVRLDELEKKLERAARAAALATGATVEFSQPLPAGERYCNPVMCREFRKNLKTLGEEMEILPRWSPKSGSSDVGNVTAILPAIHEYLWIAPADVPAHSPGFTQAAASPRADKVCVLGAQCLAMTAADIFADPALQQEIRENFLTDVPEIYRKDRFGMK